MAMWMVAATWLGESKIIPLETVPSGATNLTHDKERVWGLINSDDRESALDILTAYMVEHGDEI